MEVASSWALTDPLAEGEGTDMSNRYRAWDGGVKPLFLYTISITFKGHAYRFCLRKGKH